MRPGRTALASLAAVSLVLGTFGVTQAQIPPAKSPSTSSGTGHPAGHTGMGTPGKHGGTPSGGQVKLAAPSVASGIDTLPQKLQDKLNAKRAGLKKHHATSLHPASATGTAPGGSQPAGTTRGASQAAGTANPAPAKRPSGG